MEPRYWLTDFDTYRCFSVKDLRGSNQIRIYGAKERALDDISMLAQTASSSQEVIFDIGDKDSRVTFKLEYTFL